MERICHFFAMIVLLIPALLPGLTVEELQVSYQAAALKINENRDAEIATLNQRYGTALARLQKQAEKKGDLSEALAIQAENELITKNTWPLPPVPEAISQVLNRPRQTYLKTRIGIERDWALSLSKLSDKMEKALEAQLTSLTKEGKLKEAQSAKNLLEKLQKDPEISKARELPGRLTQSGRARAGYILRRPGDEIEVMVRYDSEGKISLNSPVENVIEKTGGTKEKGKTNARTLGEFVGAEGFKSETWTSYEKDFSKDKLEPIDLIGVRLNHKVKIDNQLVLELKIGEKATNAYLGIGCQLPPLSIPGEFELEIEYYVPTDNSSVTGFYVRHGTSTGSNIGKFQKSKAEWKTAKIQGKSGFEGGLLRIHFAGLDLGKMRNAWGDRLYLKSLKVVQKRFSATIVEAYGKLGNVESGSTTASSQQIFVKNGTLTVK